MRRTLICLALGGSLAAGTSVAPAYSAPLASGLVQNVSALSALPSDTSELPLPTTRNGQQILADFRDGLADHQCDPQATHPRWTKHFAHAPKRLGNGEDDALILFGYVVDELRKAGLPTEFALIPFVESGYRPHARNGAGPAGLWQFIATTARNHNVTMEKGYDGRLSPVESTRAAVRYLKTLYGMFGGDWRLTVMAYNAGEYRILQAIRRAGMTVDNAQPAKLPGLSSVTYQYVEKLHALACVLEKAESQQSHLAQLDRPVPILDSHQLPAGTDLSKWSVQHAMDPERIARLNPAGRSPRGGAVVLAPRTLAQAADDGESEQMTSPTAAEPTSSSDETLATATGQAPPATRARHTVRSGESAWNIARRYSIPVKRLLALNNLNANSVLKPGMVLQLQANP